MVNIGLVGRNRRHAHASTRVVDQYETPVFVECHVARTGSHAAVKVSFWARLDVGIRDPHLEPRRVGVSDHRLAPYIITGADVLLDPRVRAGFERAICAHYYEAAYKGGWLHAEHRSNPTRTHFVFSFFFLFFLFFDFDFFLFTKYIFLRRKGANIKRTRRKSAVSRFLRAVPC
jgi:hypothetical protein